MCRYKEASCRLCLTKRNVPPLLDLSQNASLASLITEVLCLRVSLSRATSHPRHVCHACHDTIQTFVTLRDLALRNEELLHESQNSMSLSSVPMTQVARFSDDDEDGGRDDHLDSVCDDEPFLPGNTTVIKSEELHECDKENAAMPIKISFIKVEKVKKLRKPRKERPDGSTKPQKKERSDRIVRREETLRARKIVEQLIRDAGAAYTPDTLLSCPTCGFSRTKSRLTSHIKWVHREADIPCEYLGCKWSFKRRTEMRSHIKRTHLKAKEQCSVCGGHFKNLDNHVRAMHLGENFPCPHCGKTLYSESGLKYHIKAMHEERAKEVCHICAKEFVDIKHHIMYTHNGGNITMLDIPCPEPNCKRMFRSQVMCRKHYDAVHLHKKEQCPQCQGWFKNLSTHISQIHKNAKRYPCAQCGKAFSKRCDVRLHVERVHNQRRYVCPECGKIVSKIRDHMKVVHHIKDFNIEEVQVQRTVT